MAISVYFHIKNANNYFRRNGAPEAHYDPNFRASSDTAKR
jgi:hypothetical protein